MLTGITLSKRFIQSVFALGIFLSAPTWATNIVGTVRKASDSVTVVAGAKVVLLQGAARLDSGVTDSLGRVTFLNVAAGNNRQLQTTLTGYLGSTVTTTVVAADSVDSVKVYLTTAIPGTITGKVSRAADSTAITGAKVLLRRSSATSAVIDSVLTDSVGNYTFTSVAPGIPNYWLTVVATGFLNGTRTNLAVANGGTATSNFFLTLPATITGFVRDIADSLTPIPGTKILLRRGSATGAVLDSTVSSALGAYTFTNVASGTPNYWLTASQSNYLTVSNANVVVPNGGLVTSNIYMTLVVPSSIQGKVVSAADSLTPIANAWLYLRRGSATSAIIDSTQTIETGDYSFSGVSPGTPNYWISVSDTGFLAATRTNSNVPNSSTVTVNFFLTVAVPATISGVVIDSLAGTPIAGVQVVLRRSSATSAIIDSALTDSSGAYSFKNVAAGTPNYWVSASGQNYTTATRNNLAVGNGAAVTVNFSLLSTVEAIRSPTFAARQKIHFIAMGDQLALELPVSFALRTVTIYSLSGKAQWHVALPAGESRTLVPLAFAPGNGFLFKVK